MERDNRIRDSITERVRGAAPVFGLTGAFLLVVLTLWLMMGGSLTGPSVYNSYTLQALAWREGNVSLGMDYPHLELAVYEQDWYVSFPPVPSVPLYFLTFLFGADTPDALLVKLYALIAVLMIYRMFQKRWDSRHAAFIALIAALGGSMLPLIMDGAVWYQAQVLAFCLTVSSVTLMFSGRTTPALFLYALAVGCRPFNVCYGPLMMLVWFLGRKDRALTRAARRLWPGIVLGLCVAAAYAVYNFVRFGDIFEFGHNYLPEFIRSEHGQFSLSHIVDNAKTFLLGLPVMWKDGGWSYSMFGCSVFLANPMLLLLLIWYASDVIRRRAGLRGHLVMLFFAAHLFLLLLHRTGGGYQLGARYAVDLVAYSLIYLRLRRGKKSVAWWEAAILLVGFAVMLAGSGQVHI